MQFVKFINKIILLILVIMANQIASAAEIKKKCGDYVFNVKIIEGSDIYDTRFELYYETTNYKLVSFYKTVPIFGIDTLCVQDIKGRYLLLLNEAYGGNATPEDVYGIFDPGEKKMLLKPLKDDTENPQNNGEQAEKIIGKSLREIYIENKPFCCFKEHHQRASISDEYKDKVLSNNILLAKEMLKGGASPYFVAKFTGLPIASVELLKNENT